MSYIVIEVHPNIEEATIVVDTETGYNKIFETLEEAQEEAKECQNGIIVEIR